jgi:hypothetical protein
MGLPGQYQVGQLYNDGKINGKVVYTQPGGVGTQVFPAFPANFPWFGSAASSDSGLYSWPASYPSQYVWGCQHRANCAEVFSYYDPYEQEIQALICCSMCGYIVQIMPLAQYQNNQETPLVIA